MVYIASLPNILYFVPKNFFFGAGILMAWHRNIFAHNYHPIKISYQTMPHINSNVPPVSNKSVTTPSRRRWFPIWSDSTWWIGVRTALFCIEYKSHIGITICCIPNTEAFTNENKAHRQTSTKWWWWWWLLWFIVDGDKSSMKSFFAGGQPIGALPSWHRMRYVGLTEFAFLASALTFDIKSGGWHKISPLVSQLKCYQVNPDCAANTVIVYHPIHCQGFVK